MSRANRRRRHRQRRAWRREVERVLEVVRTGSAGTFANPFKPITMARIRRGMKRFVELQQQRAQAWKDALEQFKWGAS